jgi:hypothetical protein
MIFYDINYRNVKKNRKFRFSQVVVILILIDIRKLYLWKN